MKISKGIEIIDLALYLEKHQTLIISDVHIGYEEALNKQGILVPRFQTQEMIKRFNKIALKLKNSKKAVRTIIINGDLKHEFGTISKQEWRDTLKFLDILLEHCDRILLIRGNHDTILGPIAEKRNIRIEEYVVLGDIIIAHGNRIIEDKKAKRIIIGHEHPAISFRGRTLEKFKCFLKGRWKKKELIIMPSFFLITEGTDIMRENLLSPYLKGGSLKNFEVFVVEDKVYNFGRLGNIIKIRRRASTPH